MYIWSEFEDFDFCFTYFTFYFQGPFNVIYKLQQLIFVFTFLDDYVFLDENESIEDEDVMVPNANSQFSQFPPNSNRNSRRLPRQRQRQRRIQKRDADLNTDYHVVYKRIQKDIQHSSDYGKFSRLDYLDFVKDSNTNQNRKNNTSSSPFFSDCIYLMS